MEPARCTAADDGIAVARRGGFVEMLEAVEFDVGGLLGVEPSAGYLPPPPPAVSSCASSYGGTMLCFGGGDGKKAGGCETTTTTSSTSSSSSNSGLSKHKEGSKEGRAGNAPKKPRKGERQSAAGSNGGGGNGKARKERIGDRIVALQQLVSPFGKSDTASVLHEALGYIKFLHDQVQVLSSPYLQQLPPSAHSHGSRSDLRSRGLCLVPLSCTTQLAGSNGADLWSAVTKH